MRIAIVTELLPQEGRVALTPSGVGELTAAGHDVFVQSGAGAIAGFGDDVYAAAGAQLVDRDTAWASAELLVKVKEPTADEYRFLRDDLAIFAFLHLAADRPLTERIIETGTRALAFETVQDHTGLPILTPMSEIAGRLAPYLAANQLTTPAGGPGLLFGGVPGVAPCRVLIIGGGMVGTQAALVSLGMQAEVTVLDTSPTRIRQLDDLLPGRARVLMSDRATLETELATADVVIGAVLVPGGAAPKVVRREHLALMKPGTLMIDIAIDQGGAFETSRPTTHDDPTFTVEGIRHSCIANLPGAVPQTSSRALTNALLPYVRRLADLGVDEALARDAALAHGENVRDGRITHPGVASAFPDLPATLPASG